MSTRSLGQLTLDLVTKTGGWVQGMDKAQRSSKRWRKQVEKDLAQVGKAFAGAATVAAAGLTALTVQGQAFVDSQAKTAARLGSTIDNLRAVQIAASDFGIDQDRLTRSLQSYTKRLGDAARGTGEAQKAYEDLGLEARDLVNLPLPEQLALIAERIAQVDSAAERSSIADRLMTDGRRLVNLFEEGGGAIRAAVKEVDEYGLSLSKVDAAKVEAANDAMSRIPRLLEPIKTQLAVAVADPLQGITNQFLDMGKASGGFRDDVHGMVDSVVDGLLFVIDAGDGVNRVFQLAGRFLALMVIDARRDFAQLAESIYSGPIDAINALIEGMNRVLDLDLSTIEQPAFVADLQRQVDQFDRAGKIARQDMQDILMAPMASEGFRQAIEDARAGAPSLGGDGAGMINTAALNAAEAVAGSLARVSEAANDSAAADEDKADKSDAAARAVEDLGNASAGASRTLATLGGGDWGKGAYSAERKAGSSVRDRIEAGKDLSAYWLEPNPTARPTWSTDRLGDLSSRVQESATWSSVTPRGVAEMQSSHAPAAKNRGAVTIKVVGDNGSPEGEVEGDDAFISRLADALSGASSASSSR